MPVLSSFLNILNSISLPLFLKPGSPGAPLLLCLEAHVHTSDDVHGKLPLAWEGASFEPGSAACSLGAPVSPFSSPDLSRGACFVLAGICSGPHPSASGPSPPQRHTPERRPAPRSTHRPTSLSRGLPSLFRPGRPCDADTKIPWETGGARWCPGDGSNTSVLSKAEKASGHRCTILLQNGNSISKTTKCCFIKGSLLWFIDQ